MSHSLPPAQLDDDALAQIQELEHEMDTVLVALEPSPLLAELSADKLAKLKDAEERLGVVMLAYEH